MTIDPLLLQISRSAITPALRLLPKDMDSIKARHMLLAIGLQESRFATRVQVTNGGGVGPARSYWQFEAFGGVRGVLDHPASQKYALAVCKAREVEAVPKAVWRRMEEDDTLGAAFARLLLWTDPRGLPGPHDAEEAWQYYLRNWRPGKPHRHTWDAYYGKARRFLYGGL